MSKKKVKRCPRCGAPGDIYQKPMGAFESFMEMMLGYKKIVWRADCSECNLCLDEDFSCEEEAINAWNTRENVFATTLRKIRKIFLKNS
jgi:hypothetical protein